MQWMTNFTGLWLCNDKWRLTENCLTNFPLNSLFDCPKNCIQWSQNLTSKCTLNSELATTNRRQKLQAYKSELAAAPGLKMRWHLKLISIKKTESHIFQTYKKPYKVQTKDSFYLYNFQIKFSLSDQCEWRSPNQLQNCWNCITKSPFSVWGKIFAKMDYTQAYTGYQNTMAGYNSAYHSAYQYATPNHLKVSQIVFTKISLHIQKGFLNSPFVWTQ